jgi:flagellar hook-length control protein FliK
MLQLSADFNLPSLPAGSILTAATKGKGGAFVDLLGLALEGQLGALQGGKPTGTEGDAALFAAVDPQAAGTDPLAMLGQDAARTELAALLLAGLPGARADLATPQAATPEDSAGASDATPDLLGIALDASRTKLPAGPAELAAGTAKTMLPALPQATASDSKADTSLANDLLKLADIALTSDEALPEALGEPLKAATKAAAPLPQTNAQSVAAEVATNAAMHVARSSQDNEMTPAASTSPVSLRIMAPLGGTEWRAEVGDRIAWMVGRGAQSAELVLNPPALGTIEVKLNMNMSGNEAGAQFFSANANVRDALEASFPRLRELLAGAGINLGDATLTSQSFADARQEGQAQAGAGTSSGNSEGTPASLAERLHVGAARLSGLVDLYI